MVFAISHIQLKAFQIDAGAQAKPYSMTALTVRTLNFHFVCPPEIISGTYPYTLREQQIGAQAQVVGKAIIIMGHVHQRSRKAGVPWPRS